LRGTPGFRLPSPRVLRSFRPCARSRARAHTDTQKERSGARAPLSTATMHPTPWFPRVGQQELKSPSDSLKKEGEEKRRRPRKTPPLTPHTNSSLLPTQTPAPPLPHSPSTCNPGRTTTKQRARRPSRRATRASRRLAIPARSQHPAPRTACGWLLIAPSRPTLATPRGPIKQTSQTCPRPRSRLRVALLVDATPSSTCT